MLKKKAQAQGKANKGLKIEPLLSSSKPPFESIEWSNRTAEIKGDDGSSVFTQKSVEAPASWSDQAVNVVASKYFRGHFGSPNREYSMQQLIGRVSTTITTWGLNDGYFASKEDAQNFLYELQHILIHQMGSFNSPVWFNLGVPDARQQVSACFINSVDDSMDSILDFARRESIIFKGGSGSGTNLSKLRASGEPLSQGGKSSGPLSFMRGLDNLAGAIKSGGTTRRAACMRILDADHPDIEAFIKCKMEEERKAHALIDAGYDGGFNVHNGAYDTVSFQNANHSVRVSDEFMNAATSLSPETRAWKTTWRTDPSHHEIHDASHLLDLIAEATHVCGDPGLQFDTMINDWHTCPNADRIYASNPCCFTGDTYVDTDEGKIRIDDLSQRHSRGETLPIAWCWDENNHLAKAAPIVRAWRAKQSAEIVEVITDRGLRLRCTPDHRFLVREHGRSSNERWVQASNLESGASLRVWPRGAMAGRPVINDRERTLYDHHLLWESINGPIPEGYVLHHRDDDKWNCSVDNLELMLAGEHFSLHSAGSANPTFGNNMYNRTLEATQFYRSNRGKYGSGKRADTRLANSLDLVEKAEGDRALYDHLRLINVKGYYSTVALEDKLGSWDIVKDEAMAPNHKVIAVIPAGVADVYDIEVQGYHNFVVSDSPQKGIRDGVIVHNSEYVFLDDTACNLASINLLKFVNDDDTFDLQSYLHTIRMFIIAMEIMVSNADYPTQRIAEMSDKYRTLGLGYCNLGAMLMALGVPYDSDNARDHAAVLTSILTGHAYCTSAQLAEVKGTFYGYDHNREPMLEVINKHRVENDYLIANDVPSSLYDCANRVWNNALSLGEVHGFRNAQVSVIAPTGTIAFMMDADTTGIEPDIALVKYKKLVGGGTFKIVNQTVARALRKLAYNDRGIEDILEYIEKNDTLEGCRAVLFEHLPVFDCAFKPANGTRSIEPMGHVKMMAAVQPFVSGAISKTVNVPADATAEQIRETYILAWKMGIKAIAIYRDGSKRTQPLSTSSSSFPETSQPNAHTTFEYDDAAGTEIGPPPLLRRKLPKERQAITHKFEIGGHEGYITVGLYDDGTPGELFLKMSKEGTMVSGLMDSCAVLTSIGLQYGVPLEVLIRKFKHTRFEPAGYTGNPEIPHAKSLMDYVFTWLEMRFVVLEKDKPSPMKQWKEQTAEELVQKLEEYAADLPPCVHPDSPPCTECGSLMVRSGSCYRCLNCGSTSGCG